MKFYIGSGMKNAGQVQYYAEILKQNGWQQTYDWTIYVMRMYPRRIFVDMRKPKGRESRIRMW